MKDRRDLTNNAIKINGEYIEDLIEGYSTLSAVGRELNVKQFETVEGIGDGATLNRSKYPVKEITIEYLLVADNQLDYVEKYNKLSAILSVEDAEVVFNNEPDKYITGSFILDGEVEETTMYRSGTFKIQQFEPFKYSFEEVEVGTSTVEIEGETFLAFETNNDGGYMTKPRFEVLFATDEDSTGEAGSRADCGFIAFSKDDYTLQFGDDVEQDEMPHVEKSKNFTKGSKSGFTDTVITIDSNHIVPSTASTTASGTNGLRGNTYGSGTKKWHGACTVYTLGTPCNNDFTMEWAQVLATTKTGAKAKKQCGSFRMLLLNNSDEIIAGFGIDKKSVASTKGKALFYGDGRTVSKSNKNLKYTGKFGYKKKSKKTKKYIARKYKNTIKRRDDVITIKTAVGTTTFKGVEVKTITKIAFYFAQYGRKPVFSSNRILNMKFTNEQYDVNTFSSGDELYIDTSDMSVKLFDTESANYGDITNDWDDVNLSLGNNTIVVSYSDWIDTDYLPDCKMYYRKRWLT